MAACAVGVGNTSIIIGTPSMFRELLVRHIVYPVVTLLHHYRLSVSGASPESPSRPSSYSLDPLVVGPLLAPPVDLASVCDACVACVCMMRLCV